MVGATVASRDVNVVTTTNTFALSVTRTKRGFTVGFPHNWSESQMSNSYRIITVDASLFGPEIDQMKRTGLFRGGQTVFLVGVLVEVISLAIDVLLSFSVPNDGTPLDFPRR